MRHRGLKLGNAYIYTASLTAEFLWAVGVCLSCLLFVITGRRCDKSALYVLIYTMDVRHLSMPKLKL